MRVSIKTPCGSELLELKNQQKRLNSPLSLLEIEADANEQCEVQIGKSKAQCTQGKHTFRIVPNNKNHRVALIRHNNVLSNIQFDYAGTNLIEEKSIENLMHFQESLKSLECSNNGKYSITDLFNAIELGEITLLSITKPLTGYDNKSLLDKLEAALAQKIRAICSSPKQGIRTDELVQDVSMVKRINTNTLTHLSSHTEHWKTRTLSGLIPKRLKADIIEDEINIYENLFFKMAIDDIAEYVTSQITTLKKVMNKNDKAIDWEEYGMKINDYNRSALLQKLMPGKDTETLSNENKTYREALNRWLKISKILVSIRSSSFYQKLDRKKRISKTVHLTNILKNDQRYKALYDIWTLVRKERQKEQKEKQGTSNDITSSVEQYYYTYSVLSLVYSMYLQDILFDDSSYFQVDANGALQLYAQAEDEFFKYKLVSKKDEFGTPVLDLTITEIVNVEFPLEVDWDFDKEQLNNIANVISVSTSLRKVFVHKKLTSEERTSIRELIHIRQSELKRKSKVEQEHYKKITAIWNKFVDDINMNEMVHNSAERNISIVPLLYNVSPDGNAINRLANELFDGAKSYVCYLMPNSMEQYSEITNEGILRKLFNYGEAFSSQDSNLWKNYRVASLPVTQNDIGSIQRLMKYISLHKTELIMEIEDNAPTRCPICGSVHITNIGANTWKCNNSDCGIEWGKTRCIKGCQEYFYWIKPDGVFELNDFERDNKCTYIMQKDSLFDKYIITDFEFEIIENNRLKPYPVCPKCGTRRDFENGM